MTQHDENCPTCGSPLSALHRAELRRCNACRRTNPAGFLYCGYCAAPMEHTEIRARVAEVEAPPGGWPNLAGDLAEVNFFLDQGEFDEAYDLLSILQRRYPGHPELADLAHTTATNPKPDAEVEGLVDRVLADSSSLGGKLPRRRAAKWDAPVSRPVERRGRKLTTAHEVVRAALVEDVEDEDVQTNPRGKVVVAEYAKNPRPARKTPKVDRTTSFEALPPKRMPKVELRERKAQMPRPELWRDSVAKAKAVGAAAKKVKDAAIKGELRVPIHAAQGRPSVLHMPPVGADADSPVPACPEATTKKEAAAEPPSPPAGKRKATDRESRTIAVDALQPPAPYEVASKDDADHEVAKQHDPTMAVAALQPAAPYEGEPPELFEARKEQIKRATNKTGRRRRVTGSDEAAAPKKRKRPRGVPPKRHPGGDESPPRRATAFGAGVLSRFGR